MSRNKKHLKSMESSGLNRKVGVRHERISATDPKKIVFSLKYFIDTQPKKDKQSYSSWEKDKRLSKLLKSLQSICNLSLMEAIQQKFIKQYASFPPSEKTDFKCTAQLQDHKWSVINKISGQKARVVGVMVGNIFYIVFFDKEHRFWISEKKNT